MIKGKLTIEANTREELILLMEQALSQVKEGDENIYHTLGNGVSIDGDFIDTETAKKHWEREAGYELSPNQVMFCEEAYRSDLELKFTYSGRGMFGKTCPSVNVDEKEEYEGSAKYKTDSMGLGFVLYAQF